MALHRLAEVAQCPPGKMLKCQVAGKLILLANVDGKFYAVDELCPHEDASLTMGCLHGDKVKCPLHGSRFSLQTGEPLEEPADEALQTYSVTVKDDSVWAEIAD